MAPGSMPIRPDSPPILRSWRSWLSRSSMSNWPLRTLAASFSASSLSIVSAARSTSETMSPMPRMREAMRSGWNGSSASNFSPTPISLTGRPVTARIDGAEQRLLRLGEVGDLLDLRHQPFVDRRTTRRVEDEDVEALPPRRLHCPPGDGERHLERHDRQGCDAGLL